MQCRENWELYMAAWVFLLLEPANGVKFEYGVFLKYRYEVWRRQELFAN